MQVPAIVYPMLTHEGAHYIVRHAVAGLFGLELENIGNITIVTRNGLEVMECLMDKLLRLKVKRPAIQYVL